MTEPTNPERLSRPLARALGLDASRLPACLVAAGEDDLVEVLRVRRAVIGDEIRWDDAAYLRWRYVLDGAGPEGLEAGNRARRLWLFKRDAEVLGCLGAEPVDLATPRGIRPALRFMDLMAAPKVNGIGIGAWLNLMLLRATEVGISVGGSDQSIGMIGRLFRRLHDRKLWSIPVATAPFLADRWPSVRWPRLASRVLDAGLAAHRRLVRAACGLRIDLEEGAAPDPETERLAETMASAGMTLAMRSEAGWRWRFQEGPRATYRFLAARRGGRLAAALVVRQGAAVADLVDWVWDAGIPEALADRLLLALFSSATERAAARGVSRVRAMTYDPVGERVCRRLGMVRRPGRMAFAIRARDPSLERELVRARWFVTFGDSDGD
jgi:hypothetical protein